MALPAMISEFGQQQANYGAAIGQSLQQLGQQVGQQLALREYQKQAAAALPALQQSYQSALGKIQAGNVSDAYVDLIGTQMQFGGTTNPIIQSAMAGFNDLALKAGEMKKSELFRQAQYGGSVRSAIASGGGMAPRQMAESALLGETQALPAMGGEQPLQAEFVDVDMEQMPQEMEGVGQPDPSTSLIEIANTAKSKAFKESLTNSAKNPPDSATLQDIQASVQSYFAMQDDQKMGVIDANTAKFKTSKEIKPAAGDKNFYKIEGANRILGKQYEGLILKPSVEAKGTTVGKSQSVTYGTNAEDLRKFESGVSGAVSELNQGRIGNFISNSGGIFNVEKDVIEEEDEEGRVQRSVFLIDKKNPDNRIKVLEPSQIQAFDILQTVPAELQRLSGRGATASLVAVERPVGKGPTREAAKGLPAMTPSAQKFVEGKVYIQGGKKYRYTQGQFVAID